MCDLTKEQHGAWFVYDYGVDCWTVYPIALYVTELEAYRHVALHGGCVAFWPFGKDWTDVQYGNVRSS